MVLNFAFGNTIFVNISFLQDSVSFSRHSVIRSFPSHYHFQAIGDSGQGAANGIIFVFFTKKVRNKLLTNPFKRRENMTEHDPLNVKKISKGKIYHSPDLTPPPSPHDSQTQSETENC